MLEFLNPNDTELDEIADWYVRGEYVPLTWSAMENQIFLAPYIVIMSLEKECMVLANASSTLDYNCPNMNFRQYGYFIVLTKPKAFVLCKKIIALLEQR